MIILSILKIIGIVLACIVGLVLLLVLLILLVPIRYRFSGDGMNADIQADGKASWLFGLLSASIRFAEKKLLYRVSVAGISLKKGDLLNPEKSVPEETDMEPQILKPQKDKKEEKEAAALEVQNKPEPEAKTEIEEEKEKEIEKEDLSDRIEHSFERLSEKYKGLIKKLEQTEAVLTSKVTGRAVKKVKEQLFHILNHIKPKKIAGNINFGLEDPANTAIIYGTIDILAIAMSEGKLIITPEFYQKGISLDMVMQGRILIGYLLVCALRVFFNKDVRRVVRVVRRMI
jgi:predicted RND superfamily exporter protein